MLRTADTAPLVLPKPSTFSSASKYSELSSLLLLSSIPSAAAAAAAWPSGGLWLWDKRLRPQLRSVAEEELKESQDSLCRFPPLLFLSLQLLGLSRVSSSDMRSNTSMRLETGDSIVEEEEEDGGVRGAIFSPL